MKPHQYEEERRGAIDLVKWFFDYVQESKPDSWSMEQVNHKSIRQQLAALKAQHPLSFDWVVVDAADFGVPQHRRRIIAGSPYLIANIRSVSLKRKRAVSDVIPEPPRHFIRNSLYSRPDDKTQEYKPVSLNDQIRSVKEPCYTILATGHKKWCDENGIVLRHLTGAEGALIQSFPPDYKLPWNSGISLIGVGNALPPLLAKAFMTPTWKPS